MDADTLLSVEHLTTAFRTEEGTIRAVDDVTFRVRKGKTLAIVGESGCGKSVTALSLMRLIPDSNGLIEKGKIVLNQQDLLGLTPEQMRKVRGNKIAMIFQEPMTALNPVYTVGEQIGEVFRIHRGMSKSQAREAAIEALKKVYIPDPHKRVDEYPFQMSGGMRQRIMIAMALACEPSLLIADEPTTALDVTIQAQILKLMRELQREHGTSIVFITHDLGVVAEMADDVVIMYAGKVVEEGTVHQVFEDPQHPYTRGLMASIPDMTSMKTEKLSTIEGTVPSLHKLPSGCRFNTRCPLAQDICRRDVPELRDIEDNHLAACHFAKGKQH